MNKRLQKLTALLLALAMTLSICPYASAAGTGEQTPDLRTEFSRVAQSAQAVDPEEWVTVVVELKGETTLDVDQWYAFRPVMPADRLSNINYGQKNEDLSDTKILKVNGIGNGYSNIFYFRKRSKGWELYKYEDTSI